MRMACVAALLAAAVAAADDKPKGNTKKELEPFQGTWSVVKIDNSGDAAPDDALKQLVLVVKGDERLIKSGDETVSKATFTVDPAKKPPAIDIAVSEGPLAGRTVKGIYELKGDTLTICVAVEGDGRPDDLTAKEGSGRVLQVFKKQKGKDAPEKP
ncbi:MAG: TIGR03067 domain-containing protein [Gemmataceae bacterium]|nr:TIGR03067 domain-containing protein [Gemmataceae bacterium]